MEKFGRWRDAGTGINPFLPNKAPPPENAFEMLNAYLLGPLHAVLRWIGLVLTTLLFGLIPVAVISRGIARFMLGLFGFYQISYKKSSLKRGGKITGSHVLETLPGDIVLVNHSSYLDYLVMTAILPTPPMFTLISYSGKVRQAAFWEAISQCWRGYPSLEDGNQQTVDELAQEAKVQGKCLVVFPEGVTSNGKGILRWLSIFPKPATSRIILVGLKYDGNGHSPAWCIGSWLKHAWFTTVRWINGLDVVWMEAEVGDVEQLSQQLAGASRLRKTALTAQDKRDFVAFWKERRQGTAKVGKAVGTVKSE